MAISRDPTELMRRLGVIPRQRPVTSTFAPGNLLIHKLPGPNPEYECYAEGAPPPDRAAVKPLSPLSAGDNNESKT